jgi:phenylacetate-CoA ligase
MNSSETKTEIGREVYDLPSECMNRKDREIYQNQRLQKIVEYAYRNAPAMKAKFDEAGINPKKIHTVKDLEKIPITRKDEVIELQKTWPPFGGLFGVDYHRVPKIFMEPGPMYIPLSISESFYQRVAKGFYSLGFRKEDVVVNTQSYHMAAFAHWLDEGLTRMGITVIPMGVGNTELQVRVLRDMKATGWVGNAGFLTVVIKKAEELGYDFRQEFSLRVAYAGGEMGGGPMRKIFAEQYGLNTGDCYGTAEMGLLAYECSEKSGLHIAEEVVLEIVDPSTGKQLGPGEEGEVVVTQFDETYPVIRFGTGDLSYYIDNDCPCGRTSRRLPRITGRVGDAVRVRSMFIHPRQVNEVVSKFPEISRCQVVVSRPQFRDELSFVIELSHKTGETTSKDHLIKAVAGVFKDICRLTVDKFEFVPEGTIGEATKNIMDKRKWE